MNAKVLKNLLPFVLMVCAVNALAAFIKLTDGTEAQVKVIRLTNEIVVVQAVGFHEPVVLNASEVEYVLLDESRPELKDSFGITLSNGSVIIPETYEIDENRATIVYFGVITCSTKEVLSVSYKKVERPKPVYKGESLTISITPFQIGYVTTIDGQRHPFTTFEFRGGSFFLSDGRINATFLSEAVVSVRLPESYIKEYPTFLRLKNGDWTFCRLLGVSADGLVLETIMGDRMAVRLSEVAEVRLDYLGELQSIRTLTIPQNAQIIFTSPELGFVSFTLPRLDPFQVGNVTTVPGLDVARISFEAVPYTLKWTFRAGTFTGTGLAIGPDGTVYVGSADSHLYAIGSDGKLRWRFQTGGEVWSSPAIGPDGTVYVGSNDGHLYAIGPDGKLKWRFQTGGEVRSSPAIGLDGTVFVGSNDNYLYAIGPDGKLKWRFQTGGGVWSSPAIGPDGTVYVGSDDRHLYAIGPDGKLKWRFQTWGVVRSSPAIGPDGTVYVGSADSSLYAIGPDGKLRQRLGTGDVYSSPAIDPDGTIYVGSSNYHVYAIGPGGKFKWSFQTGQSVNSSPAIGPDGTVYVGSHDGYVYAFGPNGSLKWRFKTDGGVRAQALSPDGTLYVVSIYGSLSAFQTPYVGLGPWPKFRGNLRNTGRFGDE